MAQSPPAGSQYPGGQTLSAPAQFATHGAVADIDTPPVIRTGLLQSTLIELPAEEKVATVVGGDKVDWVFDGGHVARAISLPRSSPG